MLSIRPLLVLLTYLLIQCVQEAFGQEYVRSGNHWYLEFPLNNKNETASRAFCNDLRGVVVVYHRNVEDDIKQEKTKSGSILADGSLFAATSWGPYDTVVCRVPKDDGQTTTGPSTTTAARVPKCEPGWAVLHESCYKVTGCKEGIMQPKAEGLCNSEGSHLVSICSDEENAFVKDLVLKYRTNNPCIYYRDQLRDHRYYPTAWIGLYVDRYVGHWTRRNYDGTVCDYANWLDGKPDNINEYGTAIGLDGRWDDYRHDVAMSDLFMYGICEKPATF